MNNKKYLVTGGAGFIGNNLVRRLLKNGYHVRVLDSGLRGPIKRLDDIRNKIELVNADIRDSVAIRQACDGVYGVFHLAYLNGTEFFYNQPELVLDIGVKGIINVIDACIEHKVKELFLASSSEVYQMPPYLPADERVPLSIPDPLNPRYSYAAGKIISEIMAINYGRKYFKKVVIFRPHNVYGPDMGKEHVIPQFIMRMKEVCRQTVDKKIKFPIHGSGKETRAFVFIDDFLDGLMLLLKNGKHLEIYNIGSSEEITIKELARELGRYFCKDIIVIPGELAKGSPVRRCPDIVKLRKLGYKPKIKLSEGLKITANWYKKNTT